MGFNPPSGWVVTNGVWNVNMELDTSTHSTGAASLKFLAALPSSGDAEMESFDFLPVEGSRYYVGECTAQANSVSAGNAVNCYVDTYDDTHTLLASHTIRAAVVASINTWETSRAAFQADATARWAKMRFSKGRNVGTANFDRVGLVRAVPRWKAYKDSAQSITAATATTIIYNNATTVSSSFNTSTGVATVDVPGVYHVRATVTMKGIDDATGGSFRLDKNSTTVSSYVYPEIYNPTADITQPQTFVITTVEDCVAGDTFEAIFYHASAGARSAFVGATLCEFEAYRVE